MKPFASRRRQLLTGIAAGASVLASPAIIRAQGEWRPQRPITIYNPFAAGGITDLHLRLVGNIVSKKLGQPVVVETRAGAAGTLAPAQMLTARPDGSTLACMSINSLRYPHYQQVSWDPLRDFSYITGLSQYTMGLVVRSDSPWKTIEDLIAAGKKEPDRYTFGTSGVGGSGHLLMIEVDQTAGAKFIHVPYKGGAEWMQALLAGEINFLADAAQWAVHVDSGACRILAMATEERLAQYPDVPTLRERGIPAHAHSPYGLVGPRELPAEIVQVIHKAFSEANDDPSTLEYLKKFVQVPWKRDPAQYRAYAEAYFRDVKPLLKAAGLVKT